VRGALAVTVLSSVLVAGGVVSPDGKWSVDFTRKNGYGHLDVRNEATHRLYRMYRSNDSCCTSISWIGPHLLIFDDDYNVKTLNPATRRVNRIAGFSNFVVSHNGRWVAGYAESGGHSAETVGVVPVGGGGCRVVPRRADRTDTVARFSADDAAVLIVRRHWDRTLEEATGAAHAIAVPLAALRPGKTC
jgi:hypothetical protein